VIVKGDAVSKLVQEHGGLEGVMTKILGGLKPIDKGAHTSH
jgi:hypothetical protein